MLIFVLVLRPAETTYRLQFPAQLDNFEQIKIEYQLANRQHWLHNQPLPPEYSFIWGPCPAVVYTWLPAGAQDCILHFHGQLAEQLTRILFQACLAAACAQITIPLDSGAQVIRDELIALNPKLHHNPYFSDW